jgi:hypothetical protein
MLTQPVSIAFSPSTISSNTKTVSVGVAGTAVFSGTEVFIPSLKLGTTPVMQDQRGNYLCGTKVNAANGFTDIACQFDVAKMRANGDLVGSGTRTLRLTGQLSISNPMTPMLGSGTITLK